MTAYEVAWLGPKDSLDDAPTARRLILSAEEERERGGDPSGYGAGTEGEAGMSDIVERLRDDAAYHREVAGYCDCRREDTVNWQHALNADEAAANIERLRRELNVLSELHAAAERECERLQAALREIVTTDPPQSSNDWFQEWKTLAFRLKSIARRALEGK